MSSASVVTSPAGVKLLDDSTFAEHVESRTDDKLCVVDFFAEWCGPCKVIAPVVGQLAVRHVGSADFFKVDVDESTATAAKYSVRAMPTFLFFRAGKLIKSFSGADADGLSALVEELAAVSSEKHAFAVPHGRRVITACVKQLEVLNVNQPAANVLDADETTFVASDCDEQMLISLEFASPVSIAALKFTRAPATAEGAAPRTVRLFINQNNMGFDAAEDATPTQELQLSDADFADDAITAVRAMLFNKVFTLTLFVVDNQEESDVTALGRLSVIGTAEHVPDFSMFQRVSGKAGEAH